jgi:CRP-like cAMP-binding protein
VRSKDHCTIGAMTAEAFHQLLKQFPEIKNRLKKKAFEYQDHWKRSKIEALKNIDYFMDLPHIALQVLQYKLQVENYEAGAKIFTRGSECNDIKIVL